MLLPDQTAGSYASVNGLKMYYEIHGSGEPLVMLHWPKLVAKAAEHARNFSGIQPEAIQAIKAPALVMVADGDIVRMEHAEELARLLHTELVVLSDSDHVSYLLEQPDVLLSKLTAFLDAPMPADK